ncbi:putative F-box protein [Tanacetum coccineum]
MEREDELQIDGSLELVNMDDHDTENKKQKREAVASSCLDSDGPYEYLCSEVSETPVITEKPLDHNDAMSYHLCEDLIDEIFIRLPFKSLVRNTSLSKSWRSRISTPSFIRKHTLRSATTQLHPQKYFIRKHVQYVLLSMGRSTVCDLLDKGYTSLKSDKRLGYCFEIVGSYNGIICLFNKGVHSITLWNPSIRRKLTVPAYPSSYKRVSFGFGFDPISNDYKIVAMSFSYYEDTQSFIYSVKTNSWSKIVSPATNVYGVTCRDGGNHSLLLGVREYNNVASWTKAFDILEGIPMNEDHKDSISYNHEAQTRLRHMLILLTKLTWICASKALN